MKNILIVCPTLRDLREIPRLGHNHNYIYEGADTREILSSFDPLVFIAYVIKKIKHEKIDAVIGTHDYPASIMASIIANMIGLDGVNVPANFLCQHKYYSREMQSRLFGSMVPEYKLLDPFQNEDAPYGFPFFLKPVKSFFSILACKIENTNQFLKYMEASRSHVQEFVEPFNRMLRKYTLLPVGAGYVMAEKICTGQQVTLEGYVYKGQVFFIGITDSIMYKGTQSFKRFDYPSSIDSAVQQRMMDVSRVWLSNLNYGNGFFNIEFFYNRRNKSISIIEINPRMCSQFADLVEKVDGINTYRLQLDLSLGKKPDYSFNRKGKFKFASSFVLRKFSDMKVLSVPSSQQIKQVMTKFEEARIEIYAYPGKNLSATLQDTQSYRYGVLNLGGNSRQELKSKFDFCRSVLKFKFQKI